MSGSRPAGGFGYQADAFAYVACYALAGRPLGWLGDAEDVPVAISMETGGPGDDLRIELASGGDVEVQAKRSLDRGAKLDEALTALARGVASRKCAHAVLLVSNRASGTITEGLKEDLVRLGQGRADGLRDITSDLAAVLRAARSEEKPRDAAPARRFRGPAPIHLSRAKCRPWFPVLRQACCQQLP